MFGKGISVSRASSMVVAIALLGASKPIAAQRGGGGGGHGSPTGFGPTVGRPGGVSEKDDLKDFHRVMALQASPEQKAAFAKIAQYAQAAVDQSQTFRDSLTKPLANSPIADRFAPVRQAVNEARAGSQNFLSSFSPLQNSGLKDFTRKVQKADAELDKEVKSLEIVLQGSKPELEQVSANAVALDKALTTFQTEQLALGGEMSILITDPRQESAYKLPTLTNSLSVEGQTVAIPTSGVVSRKDATVETGKNLFSLKLTTDLADLQQSITEVIRSRAATAQRCGERIEIRRATLTPETPAGVVMTELHFERWICPQGPNADATEVAAADGSIEIKLTPAIQKDGSVRLTAAIGHVEGDGILPKMLRSGDLGVMLRDEIAAAMLSILQKQMDMKAVLPPVAQPTANLQSAQFEDVGADQMTFVVDGQLQLSDDQTSQFVAQLKHAASIQQAAQN